MRPELPHERTFFKRQIQVLLERIDAVDDPDFRAAALLLLAALKSLQSNQ